MLPPPTLLPPPDVVAPAPPLRARWRTRVALSLVAVVVAVALAFDREQLAALVFVFVAVVPFEKLFPRHRQRLRRPQLGTDVLFALAAGPLQVIALVVGLVVGVLSFAWLPGLLLRPVVSALPAPAQMLLGFVLFDLAIYWAHRFSHEVPFLWRFHRVHHSTRHLDWVSGFGSHPADGALLAPPFVLLLAAGFPPELGGALAVVQVLTGLFFHANVRWRLRPLQRVVGTPEFHHWHHANEADAHNANYSAFLPVWDIVFGTYFVPRDRRPQVYGVDGPVSSGLLGQLRDPVRGLRNPLRLLRRPRTALRELVTMLRRGVRQVVTSARSRRPAPG